MCLGLEFSAFFIFPCFPLILMGLTCVSTGSALQQPTPVADSPSVYLRRCASLRSRSRCCRPGWFHVFCLSVWVWMSLTSICSVWSMFLCSSPHGRALSSVSRSAGRLMLVLQIREDSPLQKPLADRPLAVLVGGEMKQWFLHFSRFRSALKQGWS